MVVGGVRWRLVYGMVRVRVFRLSNCLDLDHCYGTTVTTRKFLVATAIKSSLHAIYRM